MENRDSLEFRIRQFIPYFESFENTMNGGQTSAVKRSASPGEERPRKRARNSISLESISEQVGDGYGTPNKRTSGSPDLDQVTGQPTYPSIKCSGTLPENSGRTRAVKRSASLGEEPPKKKARTCFSAFCEAVKCQNGGGEELLERTFTSIDKSTSSGGDLSQTGTSSKATPDDERLSRETSSELHETNTESSVNYKFEDKYEEQLKLGAGTYGSVFAGYRKSDHKPVAIKHIKKGSVIFTHVDKSGQTVPTEVAIMQKLSPAESLGNSVALLDWYELDQETILVMERPAPCTNLYQYLWEKGGNLHEEEVKFIIKQLLEQLKGLLDNGIFHRDIKLENILINTYFYVPRVHIIDFGMGCFFEDKASFTHFCGTLQHAPAEFAKCGRYEPGPSTVWQLGVVLFDLLHPDTHFHSKLFCAGWQKIKCQKSANCLDFLCRCLDLSPYDRATLEELQQHPWLD